MHSSEADTKRLERKREALTLVSYSYDIQEPLRRVEFSHLGELARVPLRKLTTGLARGFPNDNGGRKHVRHTRREIDFFASLTFRGLE